jgi:hypothetical protein
MDRVFTHSGATGDIIFSLPTIRAMGGGKLIITNFHKQRADSIRKLIEVQPYISSVEWSELKPSYTYDLDKFRQYASHHNNLVEAHMNGQAAFRSAGSTRTSLATRSMGSRWVIPLTETTTASTSAARSFRTISA